eukprot:753953-Hanusia_phi.AAC.1
MEGNMKRSLPRKTYEDVIILYDRCAEISGFEFKIAPRERSNRGMFLYDDECSDVVNYDEHLVLGRVGYQDNMPFSTELRGTMKCMLWCGT